MYTIFNLNYLRVLRITSICIFLFNFEALAKEVISDENKISNGTYVYDPFERINRKILGFNIVFDDIAIQPLVTGYKAITPDIAEKGIANFFSNLKEPLTSITFLIQGDFRKSFNSAGRFITNTTTSLGLYDTSKHIGLKKAKNDMGIVLGKAGIKTGPYLIIPILGPTNFRDLAGRVSDFYINPIHLAGESTSSINSIGSGFNSRVNYNNELNDLKSNSNDLYDSIKLLYHQRRMGEINKDHLRDLPVPRIYIE